MTRSLFHALSLPLLPLTWSAAAGADDARSLTESQAAEVRQIVQEVLADADERATLADGGTLAGIDDKGKVFLKSADGAYQLNIAGRVQFRYVYNDVEGQPAAGGGDDADRSEGWNLRRVNLDFNGQVGPSVRYKVQLGTNFAGVTGSQIGVEQAYGEWVLDPRWTVQAGKFWQPYARESLISSGRQVAAERGLAEGFFGLGRAEGVQLGFAEGRFSLRSALNDGGRTEVNDIGADNIRHISTAHRAEWLAIGDAKDAQDNFALADAGKKLLLLGAGAYYENYEQGSAVAGVDDAWGATADVTAKFSRTALTAALFHRRQNGVNNLAAEGFQQWGGTLGADHAVTGKVDVFVKYDYIVSDTASVPVVANRNDPLQAVTVGANWLVNRNLKLTGDLVWFVDGRPGTTISPGGSVASTGQGIVNIGGNDNDVFTVRLQAQLSF